MKIKSVAAYEILASGGYPTVEARVELESGFVGITSVPYGASAGSHEASVLMDGDQARYNGQGMLRVVKTIQETIAPLVIGLDAADQRALDETMITADGTPNKSQFGGNAILAVSLAAAQAEAAAQKKPFYKHIAETFQTGVDFSNLPSPMVVVIEGGKHADDTTDLQEFCISAVGDGSAAEKVRWAMEAYHALKKVLKANKLSTNVGNEGAFAPNGIPSNEAPFQYILEAIKNAGYVAGKDLSISIDAAASEFYHDGKYDLKVEGRQLTAAELMAYYESWLQKYPIATIEDMLAEDDWDNWVMMKQLADKYQVELIGDDLTVTNQERLQKAIDLNAISAILIKLNQIGTLTETVDCCMLARKHGLMTTTSHRGGGETNDAAMVDLAVAVGSRFIKVGPTRGERVSKYNRLLAIERELRS
ncbi:MAG TPA: phosphopyruvate hydratase [Candidatus Pacebacteria bacterium]|nr:phosphopyruvate hydratase [Candidatus Paceibacterota bacterium]